jgi:hypothetical protein
MPKSIKIHQESINIHQESIKSINNPSNPSIIHQIHQNPSRIHQESIKSLSHCLSQNPSKSIRIHQIPEPLP